MLLRDYLTRFKIEVTAALNNYLNVSPLSIQQKIMPLPFSSISFVWSLKNVITPAD